jgi:ADP-ribose pyrophosphatase YjhB (NUDIX family)
VSIPPTFPVLLGTFHVPDWTHHDIETWRGAVWPDDVPVRAVCCLLFSGPDHLVLARVATRGWDVPGGRLNSGEDIYDGLSRELFEEVGVRPFEYSAPELLGWLRVCHDEEPFQLLYFRADLTTSRLLATEVPDEILGVGVFPLNDLPPDAIARAWYPLIK